MANPDHPGSDAQAISQMLNLEAAAAAGWQARELGAILRHQLAAPLECDLGQLDPAATARLAALAASGPPVRTFGDLLRHPQPPVELLDHLRRFAKQCRNNPDSPLPDEVATVLYFAAIAAARLRCSRRITKMDDQALRRGLDWALKQPWLEPSLCEVLQSAQAALASAGGGRA